jgi:hypothetical protein
MNTSAVADQAASQHVFQIATGYIASAALYTAAKLQLADRLAAGPLSAADLARDTNANADVLYRILRTLSSVGIFEERPNGQFAHNAASDTMRSGVQGSVHDMMIWLPDPFHFRAYAEMMHSVMTGQPAAEKATGMPVFEYLGKDRDLSETFNNAMTMFSAYVIPAALDVYDFSGINIIVDVAGGHGHVLTSILKRHPSMRGILFDLDRVIAGAVPRIRDLGLQDRCEAVAGDFFKGVPAGGDAYIMKHIIHDWDDERSITILRNIRAVMKPGARVILLDAVLLPANTPDLGKLIDLEMVVMTGGRERTEEEFRALFDRAGFKLTRVIPTKSPLSVIEAR